MRGPKNVSAFLVWGRQNVFVFRNKTPKCICFGEVCIVFRGNDTTGVHPGHFATQQGTPFYPAGMSAADWSTLVFTLPRRKMAWVHPVVSFPLVFIWGSKKYTNNRFREGSSIREGFR